MDLYIYLRVYIWIEMFLWMNNFIYIHKEDLTSCLLHKSTQDPFKIIIHIYVYVTFICEFDQ